MATIALVGLANTLTAGSALASTTLFGSFTAAKAIGLGASIVGNVIDRALFSPKPPKIEGQRLSTDSLTSSINGQVVPRVYGTAAVRGQILWASRFREAPRDSSVGAKGFGPKQERTDYAYFVSLSYVLAERLDAVTVAFFDEKPRPLADFDTTLYSGLLNTMDPVIEAIEGAANTSAYRGLAHLVFDDMSISEHFGNRVPQFRAVVRRDLADTDLGTLLAAIMSDDGIALDVDDLPARTVRGASFATLDTPLSRAVSVASPRLVDLVEQPGGAWKAVPRWGEPVASYSWKQLVVSQPGEPPIKVTRNGPARVPARVHLSAPDPARDYEEVPSIQSAADEGEIVEYRSPEVMGEAENIAVASAARLDATVRRTSISCTLPPRAILDGIGVGSIIRLTDRDGARYDVQIVQMSMGGGLAIQGEACLTVDPYVEPGSVSPGFIARDPVPPVAPVAVIMDLPWTPAAPSEYGTYVAATADPWYPMAVLREQLESSGAEHDLVATLDTGATIGETTGALALGTPEAWAGAETVDIEVLRGTFTSRPQAQVAANATNAVALQAADGSWEVIQFSDATLIATDTWRLTNLYRGRGGISKAIPSGARAVLLDTAVEALPLRQTDLGVERTYEIGPAIKDVSDMSYTSVAHTAADRGRVPLPVTNIAAEITAGGVLVTWTRTEQPEDVGYFVVSIYNGATKLSETTVRHVRRITNKMLYGPDAQVEDWGAELEADDEITVGVHEVNDAGLIGPEVQETITL